MEDRVTELEIKISHQERLLTDLDEVVRAFASRVEALERALTEMREAVAALPVGAADEPPPHY
jgi:uncharacterized coiled-coil protein SlyX